MRNDLLEHSRCTIGCIGVPASDIARQVGFEFITESELDVVTGVAWFFGIVSFGCLLLVTFHVDQAAVHIDGDGFVLVSPQKLPEDLEVDLSQPLGYLIAKVPQESGYRFGFFDRNVERSDQGIALQQFQAFQFVDANEVVAEHGFDMVHLDPVCRLCLEDQIMIDQVEYLISPGVLKQQKQTSIRSEILG
jgi:hypothetical protein